MQELDPYLAKSMESSPNEFKSGIGGDKIFLDKMTVGPVAMTQFGWSDVARAPIIFTNTQI